MSRIRWGVIGACGIAQRRTIPEGIVVANNAMLAAVFDVSSAKSVADKFGVKCCETEAELLAQDIDAVYIATPVYLHAEQIERAANAGKHVLCEKPLSLDVVEAERLVKLCAARKVRLGVGLMMRFHACHVEAKSIVASGQLGMPVLARAQLSCWYPPMANAWRQDPKLGGGGALTDLGCHCIDLLEMLFGAIVRVSCQTGNTVQKYAVEDSAVVSLTFANGAMGIVDCLFNVPDESSLNRLELYGSEGSLLCEGTIGQSGEGTIAWRRRAGSAGYDASQSRTDQTTAILKPQPINTYRAQIQAFSQSILDQKDAPIDGAAGIRVQRLLEACYASAKCGRAMDV